MKSVKEKALLALAREQAATTKTIFEGAVKFAEETVTDAEKGDLRKTVAMTFLYGAAEMAKLTDEDSIAMVIVELTKAVCKDSWDNFKKLAAGDISELPDSIKDELKKIKMKSEAITVTPEQAAKMGLTPEKIIKLVEEGVGEVVMLDKETGKTVSGKEAIEELRRLVKEPDPAELDAIEKAINNTNPHGGSPWKVNTSGNVMLPDDKTVN